jgi:hypothetical protein
VHVLPAPDGSSVREGGGRTIASLHLASTQGIASATRARLFVPDPTWYRDESKESDGALTHEGGMDTRRASVNLKAGPSQKTGNEAVRGVGTFDTSSSGFVRRSFCTATGELPSVA